MCESTTFLMHLVAPHINRLLLFLFLLIGPALYGQQIVTTTWGGYLEKSPAPNLHQGYYQNIVDQIEMKYQEAMIDGRIQSPVSRSSEVQFRWPLEVHPSYQHRDFYAISFFADNDSDYNFSIKDYNCGERTYDTPNYNHSGTDIVPWPFYWNLMDEELVEVVAAADGIISGKQDGYYDRECDWFNLQDTIPNLIAIDHFNTNKTRTIYYHLKENSLTHKSLGDTVRAGEYIGIVGSSGVSNGPHLHFEALEGPTNYSVNRFLDPYNGSCNSSGSSWEQQRPYTDTEFNRISTHSEEIVGLNNSNCQTQSIELFEQDNFCDGERVHFYAFFRDMPNGASIQNLIFEPNGTVPKHAWTETVSTNGPSLIWAGYLKGQYDIPFNAVHGEWRYSILYNGQVYSQTFNVCQTTTSTNELNGAEFMSISPNPADQSIYLQTDFESTYKTIQIIDISGRVIYNEQLTFPSKKQQAVLSVADYSPGIYLVNLLSQNGEIVGSKRFVKS